MNNITKLNCFPKVCGSGHSFRVIIFNVRGTM